MLDPFEKENRPYFTKLKYKRMLAKAALWIETLSHHTWRPFFWFLFFGGLWMLSIPSFFGYYTEIITALVFFIGIALFIKQDILAISSPALKNIDRALEKNSKLPRGTINAINDTLSNPKKRTTRTLWETAQTKILHTLSRLKSPYPNIQLTKKDPNALRYLAVLFFICGLMVSGNTWKQKISNGLLPVQISYIFPQIQSTEIWITPPNYTQKPEIRISGGGFIREAINIPENSKIRIRTRNIFGQFIKPHLINSENKQELNDMQDGLYGIETTIEEGETLAIKQGFIPLLSLPYNHIIDQPPAIHSDVSDEDESTDIPYKIIEKGQISFPLIVSDDYSVKDLKMAMNIDKEQAGDHLPLGNPADDMRLIMSQPDDDFKITPVYDMTWHTWAGLPVIFEYTAIDHKGQTTKLEQIHLTLPEREFEHPTAKTLIALRKKLAWNYDDSFIDIAKNIETLLTAPDFFQHDIALFLSLRSAASRLYYNDKAPQDVRTQTAISVIPLLWDIAIAIEDGNLSLAMRDLRTAQRELENALRNPDASPDEITRLMDQLREKTQEYFREMQREMQKRMADGQSIPEFSPENFSQMISPDSLSDLMAEIEKALREGDEAKAQELMSQLQRMLEMLDPNMSAQLPSDMQMMQQGINELQELIDKQKALMEQTKKQADVQLQTERFEDLPPIDMPSLEKMLKDFGIEDIPPPPPNPNKPATQEPDQPQEQKESLPSVQDSRAAQESLRYILGRLMLDAAEEIDEIPESMGLAEQEMRNSSEQLEKNKPHASVPHQKQAIDHLEDSQEQLSQQLKKRMQQMIGIGMSGNRPGGLDPLGRPYDEDRNGKNSNSNVKIPDEHQKKRVDDILRTLRDRSSNRSLPDDELDYFRRLLRRF